MIELPIVLTEKVMMTLLLTAQIPIVVIFEDLCVVRMHIDMYAHYLSAPTLKRENITLLS